MTTRDLSGLGQLRAMLAGEHPPPAIAATMNFTLSSVGEGTATFRGTPTDAHLNPMGAVHGGWSGSILDSAMGCAVHSTMSPDEVYTTLEYKVNITRAIRIGTEVTCTGVVRHRGRTTAVATGEITGADGKIYGTGSTTCLIMPARPPERSR